MAMKHVILALLVGLFALVACGEPTPAPPTIEPVLSDGTEVVLVNKAGTHVTIWQMSDQCDWQFGGTTRRANGDMGIISNFCFTDWDRSRYYEIKIPGEGVIGWVRAEDLVAADQYTPEP
jgi:hypothetical protein